jgi:hypothetical protein
MFIVNRNDLALGGRPLDLTPLIRMAFLFGAIEVLSSD